MVARALWKGQLRLSLVPVELFSAMRTGARISFRQIHKPSGKPIRYQKVAEGIGPVDVESRKADPMFSEISGKKAEKELLEVATALIDRKSAPFDVGAFKDNYAAALQDLVKRKVKGKSGRVEIEKEERVQRRGENVVDLMTALKKSLEGSEGKKTKAQSSSSGRSRRKSA